MKVCLSQQNARWALDTENKLNFGETTMEDWGFATNEPMDESEKVEVCSRCGCKCNYEDVVYMFDKVICDDCWDERGK